MAESLLARVSSSPGSVARLVEADRLAVVHLLLEWGAVDDALACLAWTPESAGDEWRVPAAQALQRAGRLDEALAMARSLRTSGFARDALIVRLLAARNDPAALAAAEELAARDRAGADTWTLLGDVQLARGAISDAEVAYMQAARLDAHDPSPAVGLVRAGLAAGAGAAAARALLEDRGPAALRNDELQLLVAALRSTSEEQESALHQIQHELIQRYERALKRLRELLQRVPGSASRQTNIGAVAPVPAARVEAELLLAAQSVFGHSGLLPMQADIIAATRRGEDVLAVLPTGGGKSLCYQLPAFLDGGLTLVISPLVALMKDQVDQLPARLRPATVALHSGVEPAQMQTALEGMAAGRYKLAYIAPERLRQRSFVAALRKVGVARLVIDEAHCVAVWGHDFRPDYLHLPRAHADMGAPPILALTATAPPALRDEIAGHLFGADSETMRTRSVFVADPTRANLWLGTRVVKSENDRRDRLVALCSTLPGAGIVYMRSRRGTEELATALRASGIASAAYHAGLENRPAVQERFMSGEVRVIVATIAFGMGINKSDIRFILHGTVPSSLEAYVQEVGRAGRDGMPAACLLLTTERELSLTLEPADDGASLGLLQGVLQAVANAAGERRSGLLDANEVALGLGTDDTTLRVGLSILEEAGLIRRDYDAPRSLALYLRKAGRSAEFARFLAATGLAPGKPIESSFADLAHQSAIPVTSLEERLLSWQEAGHLSFYPRGRALLVSLRTRPRDAAERVQRLVEARSNARRKRAEEMVRFIRTRECRQIALAAALGGPARGPCGACDQCGMALADALLRGSGLSAHKGREEL